MTQRLLLFFIVAGTFLSCSSAKNISDNSLSKQQKEEGYVLLFDGRTMEGWHAYQNKSRDSWEIESEALHCKGSTPAPADLVTNKKYENFDLSLDYKISPKGNSGILYMVTEDNPSSSVSGPEYQIIDDINFPQKLEDWQRTAANYAMNPAPAAHPNAAGQWNHARIVVNGNHVEHWLNGEKVVEYELGSDDWKQRKNAGKWKDVPTYAKSKSGFIVFQNHGDEVWFKNIKIKDL